MKNKFLGTIFFVFITITPIPALAGVDIRVSIPLPPPILFPLPPAVVVIPDTDDVYAAPDMDIDLFFWNGWWWRPWEGRWYRSRYYDRGWGYHKDVPGFYYDIDPAWRSYYKSRHWRGNRWEYERIPQDRLHQNWKQWQNDRHWERQKSWDVRNYQPQPQRQREELRQQRQRDYHQQSSFDRGPKHQVQKQGPQYQQRQRNVNPQSGGAQEHDRR